MKLHLILAVLLLSACADTGGEIPPDNAVQAGDVQAGDVQAGPVSAGDVQAGDVQAGPVSAGDVQAGTVQAGAVQAGAVQAGAVQAGAVQAGAVQAGAVQAGDVLTGDVLLDVTIDGLLNGAAPALAPDVASLEILWTGYSNDPGSAWAAVRATACAGGVPREAHALGQGTYSGVGVLVLVDCP